jgi:acyl carrier protein phosphodiesterase
MMRAEVNAFRGGVARAEVRGKSSPGPGAEIVAGGHGDPGGNSVAMNWLAHLLLSSPDPCSRIGNLLPDLLSGGELREVHADYQNGIREHLAVDVFTDRHPVFKRSTARVAAPWRRFGGILVDVYYDHVLSRDWAEFSELPLADLVAEFHESLDEHFPRLPKAAAERLEWIREDGLLASYGSIDGVSSALARIGRRFRKPVALDEALEDLAENDEGLRGDFAEFFPEVVSMLKSPAEAGTTNHC